MKKFIFIILIIGLIIAVFGFWYWQRNSYSKEILKLEILGPAEISVSDETEFTVRYKNNGNITLEEPRLAFEFPKESLVQESSTRIEVGSEKLEDIYPGEEKTLTFKGRIFGKEGEIKTVKASMSYKPKGLSASYESNTSFTAQIKSVPLTFEFDLPSKVEAGRDFALFLNYFSNIDYPLPSLGIKIEYPSGFEFVSSNPRSLGKDEWEIPLLNKTEGGKIEINGKLSGEMKEQKIFKATFGIWLDDDFVPLKEAIKGIEVSEQSLSVFQRINGSDDYTANAGDLLHYEIFFRNIGNDSFTDLFLVGKLDGKLFDFDSVKLNSGKFNKGDSSFVWDWRDIPKLKALEPGEEGKVEFWINLKNDWKISSIQEKNSVLKNSVLISQIKEDFETKVNSKIAISQRALYNDEYFGNGGSIPPAVGNETTYTIIWELKNYYNDLRNVRVRAKLPINVKLTGKIFPENEVSKFAFDSNTREIVWIVSDSQILEGGTGILNSAPVIAFQVSLTPTADQKGETAQLVGDMTVAGEDQWTDDITENKASAIDTSLPSDTDASGKGIVQ